MWDRADAARLARLLMPDGAPSSPRAPIWTVPAWDINSAAKLEHLEALAPNLVIVSGAPILRANIFRIPKLGTLNLHFGIAPAFRGMHTSLTPWQRGELSCIGATLHQATERVDDGPALFSVHPALDATGDHVSAKAKIVTMAAAELHAMLTWIGNRGVSPLPGRVIPGPGKLIRFHDRTIRPHVRAKGVATAGS